MYRTVPTYRQGRTYYRETGERGGLAGCCSIFFIVFFLLITPYGTVVSEYTYMQQLEALTQLLSEQLTTLSLDSKNVDIVHGGSSSINKNTIFCEDPELGIRIPGAFSMRRNTEYCQWTEHRREICETCVREIEAKDGTRSMEEYPCNCIVSYDYIKTWQPYRVPSAFYDQPGAHHNPQRDPFPSSLFRAKEVILASTDGTMVQLDTPLIENIRAPWRRVEWMPGGAPRKPSIFSGVYWGLWPDTTRYEPISELRNINFSPAAVHENFVYVGQGGYFFSPYQASQVETLMKYFVEYMEGSLLDWQLGDLMPSCTAGDIRIYYEIQDPTEISFLGEVVSTTEPLRIGSHNNLGFVHAGNIGPYEMIKTEESNLRWMILFPRLALLIWSIAIAKLLGAYLGVDLSRNSVFSYSILVGSVWFAAMGMMWSYLYCQNDIKIHKNDCFQATVIVTSAIGLFLSFARQSPAANVPPGLNAVWCMIAKWAGAPPSWRVQNSYRADYKR